MKFEPKKDIKRIIIVCLAAVIMALNINLSCGQADYIRAEQQGLPCFCSGWGNCFFM